MTLRFKTLLIIATLLIGLAAVVYFVSSTILLNSYRALEERSFGQDLNRVRKALQDHLGTLDSKAGDWANWDESYAFVLDGNPDFIKTNITGNTYVQLGVNLIVFADPSRRVVFGRGFDLTSNREMAVPDGLVQYLASPGLTDQAQGILLLPEGALLFAARPILTSEGAGPSHGTLIMGRFLDDVLSSQITHVTDLTLAIYPVDRLPNGSEWLAAQVRVNPRSIWITRPGDDQILGYAAVNDVYGKPGLVIQVRSSRDIYRQGERTLSYLMGAVVLVGLVFGIVFLLVLERLVLAPLAGLSQGVSRVGVTGNLIARLPVQGRDELARLAQAINRMLSSLEQAQRRLRESEERHRAVVEQSADAIYLFSADTRQVIDCNPAFRQLIGCGPSEGVGMSGDSFIAGDPGWIAEYVQSIKSGAASGGSERKYRRRDGTEIDVWVNASAISYGGRQVLCTIVRDITERKRAEDELRGQKQLFENLVAVARATAERPSLDATLQNALDVSVSLTGAERGSLLLLDDAGQVMRSIHMPRMEAQAAQPYLRPVMDAGLAGWVARHCEAALINDTARDERWLRMDNEAGQSYSALCVPILSGGVLLGILTLTHSQEGHFSSEHLTLMQAAADQMALALRNAHMFDAQCRMADRQTLLFQVLSAVSGELDPGAVARLAVDAISHFSNWPHVMLALPSDDGASWVVQAAQGALAAGISSRYPAEHGIIGRALAAGQLQYVPDVQGLDGYQALSPLARSELAVPLRRGGRILGALNWESERADAFDVHDRLLAQSLADATVLALDNARLHTQALQQAGDLSVLYGVTRVTGSSLSMEDIVSHGLSVLLRLFNFEGGMLCLAERDDSTGQMVALRLAGHRGLDPDMAADLDSGLAGTLCAYVFERRASLVINDLRCEDLPGLKGRMGWLAALGWRAYAGIPLVHRDRMLGTVGMFARTEKAASSFDAALLTTVGHQIGTAIANAQLFESILNERSRLHALVKSNRDGVVLVGIEGRLLVVNKQALDSLGLAGQPEDWLGRHLIESLRALRAHAPGLVRILVKEMRSIRAGDEPPAEGEFDLISRTIHWLNLPVAAGTRPLGRLIVLHDVTSERAVDRMRQDMTRTMVHDLRSPLGAIYSAIEFLLSDAGHLLERDHNDVLAIARESTRRMIALVDSIMAVSRLESGQMPVNRAQVNLAELVAAALRAQVPLATTKSLQLQSDVPAALPPAWADPELMARVLQNLVGNAVKFTPAQGTICVSARLQAESSPPMIAISVRDTGPGIPPEIRGQLFQKFVTGRQPGHGSGLGLAFCKLVVEAHDGHISAESAPDQETCFTFTLPVVQTPAL